MKGKVGLSLVGRKVVPQPWSSNWECSIAETSVGSWNCNQSINQSKHISIAPYVASESEAHVYIKMEKQEKLKQ